MQTRKVKSGERVKVKYLRHGCSVGDQSRHLGTRRERVSCSYSSSESFHLLRQRGGVKWDFYVTEITVAQKEGY